MSTATFKINEHNVDRVIRVIAGLAVLSLAFVGPRTVFGYAGIIFIVTGIVGFCPIYKLLGLSTAG